MFRRFLLLAWAAWELQYSPTAWELSENILQNLRNKWPPHLVIMLWLLASDAELFPTLEVPHWLDRSLPPITLVGNLPFNVSTPLLIRLIKHMDTKENIFAYGRVPMLFTFQHEVGG